MYSIGTAARLSGVHSETIRMWERRYDLPRPARSEGGHRHYSDADIALLRAIKRLVDAGARIGAVAEMKERDILSAAAGLYEPKDGDWLTAIEQAAGAARRKDARVLEEILDRPLLQRHALEVVNELYLPLLRRVGDEWFAGTMDVASEHMVEKLVSGRIHSVLANRRVPEGAARAVCACPPGERHEVGLLAASLALKEAGFDVLHLGADVPARDLAAALALAPRLLVLACTMPPSAAVVEGVARAARAAADVSVIVGGPGAAPLQKALGRRALHCEDLRQLAALARALPTAV